MKKNVFAIICMMSAMSCSEKSKLPKEKYYQFEYTANYTYNHDTLTITISNPLNCPLRVSVSSVDKTVNDIVGRCGFITLQAKGDTTIPYLVQAQNNIALTFNSLLGDADKAIVKQPFSLPFVKNRSYSIIEGYNGSFSHNTDYSRCAIDFSLQISDTVCAAANGYVVGVIKDYEKAGSTHDWINYANYITIYHPQSGLFTQYVHLHKNGALVKVGDTVVKEQPIGLVGMTGFTTTPHLHFNVLKPDKKQGLVSTAVEFEQGYKGAALVQTGSVKK